MNRRLVLISIATCAAAPALIERAFAQNAAPSPTASESRPPRISAAGQTHIKNTLTVGSLSLMLSRIAQPKVTTPQLKQFTEFEIAEQETIASILKAIQDGEPPNGAVPTPSDAEVMQNLDAAGRNSVEKLRKMSAGLDFDREYLLAELAGHRQLLEIQQAYLRAPDNLDETNVAKLAQGMIKEHLTLLGDMEGAERHAAATQRTLR